MVHAARRVPDVTCEPGSSPPGPVAVFGLGKASKPVFENSKLILSTAIRKKRSWTPTLPVSAAALQQLLDLLAQG